MPLPDQAQALRLADGVPMLHVISVTLTEAGKPLSLEEFNFRAASWRCRSGCSAS
ncbi:hypothetical protein Q3A86_24485 [Streptomyces sp. NBUA17]|uniref:hypothetical protein n=1 Tax=Streptomyces sp. NBUA17 TaxID=3062275 RepID=UPI0037DA755B